ncbi:MAG: hypothetical protein WAK63_18320 [Xanthobacteraceae bacterium]
MPVSPTGVAMEEVTVVTAVVAAAVVTTAMVTATMVTATVVTAAVVTAAVVTAATVAPCLCRRISRGHHQTGYAYGGETINCKQGACC